MSYKIEIEVDEDTHRSLNLLASNLDLESTVLGGNLVREQLQSKNAFVVSTEVSAEQKVSEFRQILTEIEEISRRAGSRPVADEALTREAMYADHD